MAGKSKYDSGAPLFRRPQIEYQHLQDSYIKTRNETIYHNPTSISMNNQQKLNPQINKNDEEQEKFKGSNSIPLAEIDGRNG